MVPSSNVVGQCATDGPVGVDAAALPGDISGPVIGELRASLALVQLLALNSIFEVAQCADRDALPIDDSVRRLIDSSRLAVDGVDAVARAWADRRAPAEGGERGEAGLRTNDGAWLQLLGALANGSAARSPRRGLAS